VTAEPARAGALARSHAGEEGQRRVATGELVESAGTGSWR
jgi:hypothetical protein